MALDGTEVRVAGGGHVYLAPAGTALPEDLSALAVGYVDMGYVSEDGVTFTMGRETDDINAWQGSKVRVVTTGDPVTAAFTLIQSNADVLKAAFGGGTIVTTAGVAVYTPPASGENTERVLVVEFVDGDITYRFCMARVQVQDNVEFTLTRTGAVGYPLTFGVLDNGDEAKWILITDDEAVTGP